jgi:hypothetical protein
MLGLGIIVALRDREAARQPEVSGGKMTHTRFTDVAKMVG